MTLTKIVGQFIKLLREYVNSSLDAGVRIRGLESNPATDSERPLGYVLRELIAAETHGRLETVHNHEGALTLLGKLHMIRAAMSKASVHVLSKGPIEAYYEAPPAPSASDFAKQQALQTEFDAIWSASTIEAISERYAELLEFVGEASDLEAPVATVVREPIADLIHLLQREIRAGRVKNLEEARQCELAVQRGYWYICDLLDLSIEKDGFRGRLVVKEGLGGSTFDFDAKTLAYECVARAPQAGNRDTA